MRRIDRGVLAHRLVDRALGDVGQGALCETREVVELRCGLLVLGALGLLPHVVGKDRQALTLIQVQVFHHLPGGYLLHVPPTSAGVEEALGRLGGLFDGRGVPCLVPFLQLQHLVVLAAGLRTLGDALGGNTLSGILLAPDVLEVADGVFCVACVALIAALHVLAADVTIDQLVESRGLHRPLAAEGPAEAAGSTSDSVAGVRPCRVGTVCAAGDRGKGVLQLFEGPLEVRLGGAGDAELLLEGSYPVVEFGRSVRVGFRIAGDAGERRAFAGRVLGRERVAVVAAVRVRRVHGVRPLIHKPEHRRCDVLLELALSPVLVEAAELAIGAYLTIIVNR